MESGLFELAVTAIVIMITQERVFDTSFFYIAILALLKVKFCMFVVVSTSSVVLSQVR